ncbi:MAG: hypothetical protein GF311_07130 [Candidatus Lokiarchaeota archaeon]|nr:hypothetical protein [Candidatus Lokiarchaeota archaeon]
MNYNRFTNNKIDHDCRGNPVEWYCPRCGSTKIVDHKIKFYCPRCDLTFIKKQTRQYRCEDELTDDDKEAILDSFAEDTSMENLEKAFSKVRKVLEEREKNKKKKNNN